MYQFTSNEWLTQSEKKRLTKKSDLKAITMFVFQLIIYFVVLIGAIGNYYFLVNILCSIYLGLVIGQLFIIGHDACHQFFAATPIINKIIGRIAFLFSFHSYSWLSNEHNLGHHKYTNIKGKDYIWQPMTKKEFEQQNQFRRCLERLYRSPIGAGIYYFIELWLFSGFIPIIKSLKKKYKKYLFNSILVCLFIIIQPLVIVLLGQAISPDKTIIEIIVLGWIIPFISWSYIVGVIAYIQHTHPKVAWFEEKNLIPFCERQIHSTIRVIFPEKMNSLLLYNVMEHHAHHLIPSIPVYNLLKAQEILEDSYVGIPLVYRFSIREYLNILKNCQLFDFEKNCWTDFNGNPTTPPIVYKKDLKSLV